MFENKSTIDTQSKNLKRTSKINIVIFAGGWLCVEEREDGSHTSMNTIDNTFVFSDFDKMVLWLRGKLVSSNVRS